MTKSLKKESAMKDSVIISTGHARLHLFYAAIGAQEAGLLHSMLTSFYLRRKWLPLAERMAKLSKRPVWRRLLLWRDDGLSEQNVISLGSTEVVSRLCMIARVKAPFESVRFWLEKMDSLYYGRMANRHIRAPVKLIHSRSGFSRAIIPHAHKIGARVLLEQSIAHPLFARGIMEEEYEKWGVPDKHRVYAYPEKEMERDIECSDYILTNSDFCANTIRSYIKNPKAIRVVYTGVDVSNFSPSVTKNDDEFTILFVGAINIRKGVAYAIKAFRKLRLSNAKLLIVGGRSIDAPPIFDECRDRVKYVPHIPYSEVPKIMANASVFVFPSLVEGSARVVGEAMASGLSCIVTPNAGSIIQDGVEGFIVPPKDVDALAEKILCLYKNRDLVVEMGRAARKSAVNKLTWEHYQKNLIRVYKEILQEILA